MRSGAEYFTRPGGAGQRRYEAMRAYFVEGVSAAEVADGRSPRDVDTNTYAAEAIIVDLCSNSIGQI